MKIVLLSMPDVAPVIMHEAAFHMPNCGIASIGANIDSGHDVYIIDLIRKRSQLKKYLTQTLLKILPELVGLSAMAWQYETCIKLIRLIKHLLPNVKIVIGGYHVTLMHEEIAVSDEADLIDFMIRGEGEEACRRLANALEGRDRIEDIPSLTYKSSASASPAKFFVHNPRGELLDLSRLKPPIRDKRRLTYGIMVVGGLIFGFPDDDETAIVENYQLQYLVWYHRQKVMGWWEPSERIRSQGRLWTSIWLFAFRPMLQYFLGRTLKKYGWQGRYQRAMKRQAGVNVFKDLEEFNS